MNNIIPNIQNTSTNQLHLFRANLSKKPYCSNDLAYGLKIRTASHAITHRYIQHNQPNSNTWLAYDIDRRTSVEEITEDLLLPAPTLFIQNPENGHAHVLFALKTPLHLNKNSSYKAMKYHAAVDVAFTVALGADRGYVGLVVKNPLNSAWRTRSVGGRYDLATLADYVEVQSLYEQAKYLPDVGLGRNCTLFDMTREYAYKAVRAYRSKSADSFYDDVLTQALCYNTGFTTPLNYSEVKATAKQIAKFCLKSDTEAERKFKERQSFKGKRSGQTRLSLSADKRTQARELAENSVSKAEIARLLNVHRNTVNNWLN